MRSEMLLESLAGAKGHPTLQEHDLETPLKQFTHQRKRSLMPCIKLATRPPILKIRHKRNPKPPRHETRRPTDGVIRNCVDYIRSKIPHCFLNPFSKKIRFYEHFILSSASAQTRPRDSLMDATSFQRMPLPPHAHSLEGLVRHHKDLPRIITE